MAAVQFQATVAFGDVAAYFSEKQWTCLEEWQKEVYKRAMENIHLVILSLGHTIDNPDVLVKLRADNEVYVKDPQNPGIERLECCSTSSQTMKAPDILLCISTDDGSDEWKVEAPNKGGVRGVTVPEHLKAAKDETSKLCYDHDYGPGTELHNPYGQTLNASKSSATNSETILWNNENLGTAGEIEVIIPCSLTEKPSHVLLWSKDSGASQKQNGINPKVKAEQRGPLKSLPGVIKRKRKVPKTEPESCITPMETTNVEVTSSDLQSSDVVFGDVYSMFNMDQAHKGQMKHVVTAEELSRRFAEPERFSLRFAQRYLRQRKDGVSNLGDKCRQHNLKPSKNIELTSAWTLITEGDVKYLLESTQTLAAEYWPSKELAAHLNGIFPASSSRILQLEHTRDYLDNLQASLSEKLVIFDLVTHGGADQLVNIVIDCIKSTIDMEMALQGPE